MGIFLMVLGVFLTLDRLQLLDVSWALRLWPVGFVVLGTTLLVRRPDAHGRFWGIGWVVLGAWLLLNTMGILRVGFWDLFWPLVLMIVGVRLTLRALGREAPSAQDGGTGTANGSPNLIAVLSESKRSFVNEPFRGAHLTSVLGGCVLDLRQATVVPGQDMVVDVFSFMGGQDVVVPSAWVVVSEVVSVLAAVDDKRLPAVSDPSAAGVAAPPRLVLRGVIIFSGLTIKT
jgi:hypothetical protein